MGDIPQMMPNSVTVEQFNQARWEAQYTDLLARLTGRNTRLLSYHEVRQKLRAVETGTWELRDIPIDAIVGSVGRVEDFTRNFLPRLASDRDRWVRVMRATTSLEGLPPIEVYQVGEVYFVQDGNHRVSVARRLGAKTIQAYVKHTRTRVPLRPDDRVEDLILKSEYALFLEETHLDTARPGVNLTTTLCSQYDVLRQQIEVYQFMLELQAGETVTYDAAAAAWYDAVYLPLVETIREKNLLKNFPGRTEADLFLWLVEHHAEVGRDLGWSVRPASVVEDLVARYAEYTRSGPANFWAGLWRLFRNPAPRLSPPVPGAWRTVHLSESPGRLFSDIMAVLPDPAPGAALPAVLEYALAIAQNETSRILGVTVRSAEQPAPALPATAAFPARFAEAGVEAQFAAESGSLAEVVEKRARWVDLVLLPVEKAPGAPLPPAIQRILRAIPTPLLLTPPAMRLVHRALLLYDDSPSAREALFLAAYLASFWEMKLAVLAFTPAASSAARGYLEGLKLSASYEQINGAPPSQALAHAAQTAPHDLVILGGGMAAGAGDLAWVEAALDAGPLPVLVCK